MLSARPLRSACNCRSIGVTTGRNPTTNRISEARYLHANPHRSIVLSMLYWCNCHYKKVRSLWAIRHKFDSWDVWTFDTCIFLDYVMYTQSLQLLSIYHRFVGVCVKAFLFQLAFGIGRPRELDYATHRPHPFFFLFVYLIFRFV